MVPTTTTASGSSEQRRVEGVHLAPQSQRPAALRDQPGARLGVQLDQSVGVGGRGAAGPTTEIDPAST